MSELYLHGVGHFHPRNVIDNQFLEELDIDTNDEWIMERVGIRTRHTVLPLDYLKQTHNQDIRAAHEAAEYSNAETGKQAALHAMERAGITPDDIGMVICGSVCSDLASPAEACPISALLGIEVPAIDINSACTSFAAAMHMLRTMDGLPPYVLVVNPENITRVVNYRERAHAVLFGDCATSVVVSREIPSRARITQTTLKSSPSGWNSVWIPRLGHFDQQGNAVQKYAIKTTSRLMSKVIPVARERVTEGGRFHFIGHQANLLMLESAVRRAGITEEEHWFNVVDFGNTSSAGAPSVLSQRWDEIKDGDTVAMALVGSGLTWASILIEFKG